ncbi:GNAT family N-acetyltransferase [Rufibacter sp. XAAS-G3-1]|uniref:GNAT family N-acetyltransferase n=1 Tax=Rufibacter sp. XAAS-G3-1 TaxID=2729134 RepID=UPI0015E7D43A|nr:GNAT family N-acetyltransferase [Rufibacter sp. XAAS-G3-1]
MIQVLRHHEINFARWAACLLSAPEPLVYLQAWYLDVVCGGQWEALVEVQDDEYVSLFPLPVKKLLGSKKVYQPLFTQQLGLVTTPASRHKAVEEYLAFLPELYTQVQYQMALPKGASLELPEPWVFRLRPNYELSLAAEYAVLRQHYTTNHRRNLKKAETTQLVLVSATTISPLLGLFQSTKGKELPYLRPRHYQKLEKLYRQAQKEGVGEVWEVRNQNKLLAAAFILRTAHRITFLFGASAAEGRTRNAMAFLLDQLMQQEGGSGKTFDFEGSEVPGVANFYAGFGAQPVMYVSLSSKPKPTTLQWPPTVFTFLAKHLR